MKNTIYRIYCLTDPRNGSVGYVGRTTVSLHERWVGHISEAKAHKLGDNWRCRWIQRLAAAGVTPAIHLLEETSEASAERQWLEFFRIFGHKPHNKATIVGTSLFERR